ncbi:WD40 repeat-like protein, partial [Piromyces finnis]
HVLFHPVADNVLASASGDLTIRIWDITNGSEKVQLTGCSEIIQSISWSYNGSLLCSSCRDKKLRVFDVRSGKVAMETSGHQGVKGSRAVWMGDLDKIATTGFSRTSDRQIFVYDTKNFGTPIIQENIDTSSVIQEYDPQRGMGYLPKRAVNTSEVEVARLYKLHSNAVEPFHSVFPRKSDNFASDIYTDTCDGKPALTCEEFFSGKDANPLLFNLKDGFVPVKREFSVDNAAAAATLAQNDEKMPTSEKELKEAYKEMKKEIEQLKSTITQKDIKIRQLEAQLEQMNIAK